jgi:gamma-glutamylcyclotransferase (GGCT)/AIG2-like uncharacterized protein YtfP
MVGVFVYGTLMPGGPLWPVLAPSAVSWQPATAAGSLWDTGLGYPAARFDDPADGGGRGGGGVPGVLVAVDPSDYAAVIDRLDDIEEEGMLYRRVEVQTSAGPAVAYEWLGPTDGLALLAGGWSPPPSPGRERAGTADPAVPAPEEGAALLVVDGAAAADAGVDDVVLDVAVGDDGPATAPVGATEDEQGGGQADPTDDHQDDADGRQVQTRHRGVHGEGEDGADGDEEDACSDTHVVETSVACVAGLIPQVAVQYARQVVARVRKALARPLVAPGRRAAG